MSDAVNSTKQDFEEDIVVARGRRSKKVVFRQPGSIRYELPLWLADFAKELGIVADPEERMSFVIEAARRNVAEETGGPFAAAVFEMKSGKLISLGVNLVPTQCSSLLHAEIVAIALAQEVLGTYDLGGDGMACHELVCSTEPCAMCLGAIPWSGIRNVVTGARDCDAREAGFDEGPKVDDWCAALKERGIAVTTDLRRAEAAAVLQVYARGGGAIYNAREGKGDS